MPAPTHDILAPPRARCVRTLTAVMLCSQDGGAAVASELGGGEEEGGEGGEGEEGEEASEGEDASEGEEASSD